MKHATAVFAFIVVSVLCAVPAFGQTAFSWSKGANGNWSESTSWTPNGVPGPGDSATIDTPYQVTLSATTTVASLTVKNSGASLLLSGNITLTASGTVDITSSGIVYFQPAGAVSGTYVRLVAGNLNLGSTGQILGDSKGYPARYGPLSTSDFTSTINSSTVLAGKDANSSFEGGGAGSHGGAGGQGEGSNAGGLSYGNGLAPLEMGSGGGRGQNLSGQWANGGAGGGAIKIEISGTCTINGVISANGGNGSAYSYAGGGGGGGGSIYITTGTLQGTGTVRANGGNGGGSADGGGGGGGGRVAIVFNSGSYALAGVTANGGANTGGSSVDGSGGSIWIQDQNGTTADETDDDIRAGGTVTLSGAKQYATLTVVQVLNGASAASGSVTFSNSLQVASATIQTKGSLTVQGTTTVANTLTVNGTSIHQGNTTATTVTVSGGVLDLRNNITLSVSGNMSVINTSTLYFRPASSTTDTYVKLAIAGNLMIDASSTASGNGFGYAQRYGPASLTNLTATINSSSSYVGKEATDTFEGGGGGSHGGNGGQGDGSTPGGLAYGDGLTPITMGSGGGRGLYTSGTWISGGAGGGAVWIDVGNTLTLNGKITANGSAGSTNSYGGGGGGAGGSVRITTITLSGTGTVNANGGAGGGSADGGGGGSGGRVAIYFDQGTYALASVTANGGANSGGTSTDGQGGSLWIQDRNGTPSDETNDDIRAGGTVVLSGNKQYNILTVIRVVDGAGVITGHATFQNNLTVNTLTLQSGGGLKTQGVLTAGAATNTGGHHIMENSGTVQSLTLNSAALMDLKNNITLTVNADFKIQGNSVVTFKPASAVTNTFVSVVVKGNLILDAGSKFDGTGLGYVARYGPKSLTDLTSTLNSSTIYAGQEKASAGGGGGGHGADGGYGDADSGVAAGGTGTSEFFDPFTGPQTATELLPKALQETGTVDRGDGPREEACQLCGGRAKDCGQRNTNRGQAFEKLQAVGQVVKCFSHGSAQGRGYQTLLEGGYRSGLILNSFLGCGWSIQELGFVTLSGGTLTFFAGG